MKSLLGIARRSDVVFRANGHFDLAARVVRTLGISPGDAVDVLSDGVEYYLYVSHRAGDSSCGRFEARVFPSKSKSGSLHFRGSSARLCRAMLSACHASGKASFPCGETLVDNSGRHLLSIIVRINLSEK